ncbi:4-hydroxy-tetrahydrodipicolinate synthase [Belnapia sp. T18]|uniref:4-hydroxy-tetrahydrodipicolinate synthase n=1 Tax=Belnapia arida TaxID=2804533 RepID=A0ABS1U969_9PROT|nr:4-hydroxy-tetrahydrodipicolinate synthase [Belnapia arida]MBL6081233.1 4-hydroxy-tetrahydrodipicolinate synthase [Belnapia arida]
MTFSVPLYAGSVPALVTPFRHSDGAVDEAILSALADRAVKQGSSAILVCGSTGEAPALLPDEHARIVRIAAETVGSKAGVFVGVGASSTEAAVRLAVAAERCGASALLCSAPPYIKPGQDGLIAHIRAVAAASVLPIILYDVPSRAAVCFADDTIARLYDDRLIQALKDATGDLARVQRLRALCGTDFPQMSGDDATAVAHLAMGGIGCISVTANVVPGLCAALQEAWALHQFDKAFELRDKLAPLHAALFTESNPIPVKAALSRLGLCESTLRLPLLHAKEPTRLQLARILANLIPAEQAHHPVAMLPRPAHGEAA